MYDVFDVAHLIVYADTVQPKIFEDKNFRGLVNFAKNYGKVPTMHNRYHLPSKKTLT